MCVEVHVFLVHTEFSLCLPLGIVAQGSFRSLLGLRTSFKGRSWLAGGGAAAVCLWFDLGNAEAPES